MHIVLNSAEGDPYVSWHAPGLTVAYLNQVTPAGLRPLPQHSEVTTWRAPPTLQTSVVHPVSGLRLNWNDRTGKLMIFVAGMIPI
jgi:hypothetical protein